MKSFVFTDKYPLQSGGNIGTSSKQHQQNLFVSKSRITSDVCVEVEPFS